MGYRTIPYFVGSLLRLSSPVCLVFFFSNAVESTLVSGTKAVLQHVRSAAGGPSNRLRSPRLRPFASCTCWWTARQSTWASTPLMALNASYEYRFLAWWCRKMGYGG
ncbi:hypothetical protein IWX49DRAFT_117704 [Phyllosticta citricarpa]|uniref:Secreted protein n=1 Tax=Phyllosticta citricarpa TaxID=55181 RepID=A0ABR1MD69_9PEZI